MIKKPLFPLGHCVITPGAAEAFEIAAEYPRNYLSKHVRGEWGDLDPFDVRQNNEALRLGNRLLSAYHLKDGTKIWIITEWDRSATTILLPSEY